MGIGVGLRILKSSQSGVMVWRFEASAKKLKTSSTGRGTQSSHVKLKIVTCCGCEYLLSHKSVLKDCHEEIFLAEHKHAGTHRACCRRSCTGGRRFDRGPIQPMVLCGFGLWRGLHVVRGCAGLVCDARVWSENQTLISVAIFKMESAFAQGTCRNPECPLPE